MAGVTEGCEVEAGAGEEAAEQAGPVLHTLEPGLDQAGELGEVAFSQVGQGSFQVGPDWFSVVVTMQVAMDGGMRARRLSAGRACFGWLSWLAGCRPVIWPKETCCG